MGVKVRVVKRRMREVLPTPCDPRRTTFASSPSGPPRSPASDSPDPVELSRGGGVVRSAEERDAPAPVGKGTAYGENVWERPGMPLRTRVRDSWLRLGSMRTDAGVEAGYDVLARTGRGGGPMDLRLARSASVRFFLRPSEFDRLTVVDGVVSMLLRSMLTTRDRRGVSDPRSSLGWSATPCPSSAGGASLTMASGLCLRRSGSTDCRASGVDG